MKAPVFLAAFLFLPMKAINFGISGDRTESMLWRMEGTGLAVKTPPRYCVLLAGTNNIGLWKGKQPAEETVKGIREVAVRLLKKFPETRLILMEVTPYGPHPAAPLRFYHPPAAAALSGSFPFPGIPAGRTGTEAPG